MDIQKDFDLIQNSTPEKIDAMPLTFVLQVWKIAGEALAYIVFNKGEIPSDLKELGELFMFVNSVSKKAFNSLVARGYFSPMQLKKRGIKQ